MVDIDRICDAAVLVAKRHFLSLKYGNPTKDKTLISINGDEPEYRIGFSLTDNKDGTYHIWSMVTDLRTGAWQQDIRTEKSDHDITNQCLEVLNKVDQWIKANHGLDAKEEARKRDGRDYYWDYEKHDGIGEWSVEFPNGMLGSLFGEAGYYEGTLNDEQEFTGKTAGDVIKKIEAAYRLLSRG